MLWTQRGFWIYQICCLCLSKCSRCSSVEGRQTHPITIQSSRRRWTRPLFIFQKVERHSSIRMTGKSLMEKKEPRQERGKEAVGRGRGLWEQHRACSSGAACLLGRLPFVQIGAGDTAKLFFSSLFVIQTDRAFLWLPYRINFRSDARGYSI